MSDWLGLFFLVFLVACALIGLKVLARPATRTEEEFERNVSEGTTALGASMNALHELMNPEAAKSKEVQMQMKDGRYGKKRREGKANDSEETEES